MTPEAIRKINLLECLLDEHPDVDPPPDDAVLAWTERQLRDYFALTSRAAASALQQQRPDKVEALATGNHTAQTEQEASAAACATWAGALSGDDNVSSASCQPGGGVEQVVSSELDPANAPSTLRTHQLAATVDGYRRAAVADEIPSRCHCQSNSISITSHVLRANEFLIRYSRHVRLAPWNPRTASKRPFNCRRLCCRLHGLFPPNDPLLAELASMVGSKPFEKHMAGFRGPHQLLPAGGWTTGDSAAQAGFDLRMFWLVRQHGGISATAKSACICNRASPFSSAVVPSDILRRGNDRVLNNLRKSKLAAQHTAPWRSSAWSYDPF